MGERARVVVGKAEPRGELPGAPVCALVVIGQYRRQRREIDHAGRARSCERRTGGKRKPWEARSRDNETAHRDARGGGLLVGIVAHFVRSRWVWRARRGAGKNLAKTRAAV
jgi:hypothetical protein